MKSLVIFYTPLPILHVVYPTMFFFLVRPVVVKYVELWKV